MNKMVVALAPAVLLAACGSSGGGSGSSSQIKVVGSSTVYPFAKAVAENFQRTNAGIGIIVESTGTGAGIKLFCGGVGDQYPDLVSASRPLKASEYEACSKAGAKQIIEVPVGIDGLTLIEANDAQPMKLSVRDVYAAIAATPFGKPNTAKTWKDVNPALPAVAIRVMGPPPTSGTRDSLAELILTKGCETDSAMKALKKVDEAKHKDVCTKVREDGAYVEAGENDNLLVQKVAADPGTVGVLGYSFLAENADKVRAIPLGGVNATAETISNLTYPGARKLFIYAKAEHIQAKPLIRQYIAAFAKAWGKGGPLERLGLVPLHDSDATQAAAQAAELKPLDPATLK